LIEIKQIQLLDPLKLVYYNKSEEFSQKQTTDKAKSENLPITNKV